MIVSPVQHYSSEAQENADVAILLRALLGGVLEGASTALPALAVGNQVSTVCKADERPDGARQPF